MTASRALGSGDNVAPETLARIRNVAAQLGYVRTRPPAHLGPQTAGLIGVIIPTIADSLFADFLEGIESAARPEGYDILLGVSGWDEQREEEVVRGLLSRRPDGLLFAGLASPSTAAILASQLNWLRVAETWEHHASPLDILVGFDNFSAGEIAGRFLLERGYRHLIYCGPTTGRDGLRCAGFSRAALEVSGTTVEILEDNIPGGAGDAGDDRSTFVDHVLRCGNHPAIFCATDEIAYSFLFEFARRGVGVPADVAICGCGDRPLSGRIEPRLTTIRIPTKEMGYQAGQKLIGAMQGAARIEPAMVPPQLMVRRSC